MQLTCQPAIILNSWDICSIIFNMLWFFKPGNDIMNNSGHWQGKGPNYVWKSTWDTHIPSNLKGTIYIGWQDLRYIFLPFGSLLMAMNCSGGSTPVNSSLCSKGLGFEPFISFNLISKYGINTPPLYSSTVSFRICVKKTKHDWGANLLMSKLTHGDDKGHNSQPSLTQVCFGLSPYMEEYIV